MCYYKAVRAKIILLNTSRAILGIVYVFGLLHYFTSGNLKILTPKLFHIFIALEKYSAIVN